MNYDFNNIEDMLRAGLASPEDIANAFADALNDAIANTHDEEWQEAVDNVWLWWNTAVDAYVKKNHLESKVKDSLGSIYMDAKTVEGLISGVLDLVIHWHSVEENLNDFIEKMKDNKNIKKNSNNFNDETKEKSYDKVMADFFKTLGI